MKYKIYRHTLIALMILAGLCHGMTPRVEAGEEEWRDRNKRVINLFAQGQRAESLEMMKEIVEITKQEFGEGSVFVAKSMNNLGNFHFHMGQVEEARKTYLEAIEIEKKIANANALVADSYFNLAMTYASGKETVKAKELLQKSLEHYQKAPKGSEEAIKRVQHLISKIDAMKS